MIILAWNGGSPIDILDFNVFKKVLSIFITAAIMKLGKGNIVHYCFFPLVPDTHFTLLGVVPNMIGLAQLSLDARLSFVFLCLQSSLLFANRLQIQCQKKENKTHHCHNVISDVDSLCTFVF
jgi:hypothetical protein